MKRRRVSIPDGVARQRWRWLRKASVLLARLVAALVKGLDEAFFEEEEEEEDLEGAEGADGPPGTGSPVGRSMGLSTTWDADSVILGDLVAN